jgi:hypothetical protein
MQLTLLGPLALSLLKRVRPTVIASLSTLKQYKWSLTPRIIGSVGCLGTVCQARLAVE